jgi:hypothetical protein
MWGFDDTHLVLLALVVAGRAAPSAGLLVTLGLSAMLCIQAMRLTMP